MARSLQLARSSSGDGAGDVAGSPGEVADALVVSVEEEPPPRAPARVGDVVLEPRRDGANDFELVRMWLFDKAESTRRQYSYIVFEFFAFIQEEHAAGALDGDALPLVTIRHLHAYQEDVEARGLAPNTVRTKLATIKSLLSYAHKLGYVGRNWGEMLSLPSTGDSLTKRLLTKREVQQLIFAAEKARDEAMLELLYHCGLRAAECAGACIEDLAERPGLGGGQITVTGKGSKTRTVLINGRVWDVLHAYLAGRTKETGPKAPLFRSRKGGHLHPSSVWRRVKKVAEKAGVREEVSTHWLRHAHASHALSANAPVHQVKDTLGHASLATTTRYSHANPDESSSQYLE